MVGHSQNTGRWTKSKNAVILSVLHQHQNPLEYTYIPCKPPLIPSNCGEVIWIKQYSALVKQNVFLEGKNPINKWKI
jgi:hypothetical protein